MVQFDGDRIWLRGSGGEMYSLDPEAAKAAVTTGQAALATEGDVKGVERARELNSETRQLATLAEGALAGGADAIVGLGKRSAQAQLAVGEAVRDATGFDAMNVGAADALAGAVSGGRDTASQAVGRLSGRQLLKDLANIGGTANEYMSGSPVAGESARTGQGFSESYDDAARQRAIDNPGEALVGRAVGEGTVGLAMGGVGGGIAGLAAQGAVEGALSGMAQADEDAWIKDKETTSEALLWGAGLGGVLGAGAGAGLGLLGKGAKRLSRSMYDAASDATSRRLAGEAGGMLDDGMPRFTFADDADAAVRSGLPEPRNLSGELAEEVIGEQAQRMGANPRQEYLLRRAALGKEASDVRRVGLTPSGLGDFVEESSSALANRTNRLREGAGAAVMTPEGHIGTKWSNMAPLAADDMARQAPEALQVADTFIAKVENALIQADASDATLGSVMRKQVVKEGSIGLGGMQQAREMLAMRIRQAKNGGDIAMALDQFKRDVGKLVQRTRKRGVKYLSGDEFAETEKALMDAYDGVKNNLENGNVWGPKFAGAQREINSAVTEKMLHTKAFDRVFGNVVEMGERGWSNETKKAFSSKFKTLVRSLNADELPPEAADFQSYLRATKREAQVKARHGIVDEETVRGVTELSEQFDEVVDTIQAGKMLRNLDGEETILKKLVEGVPFVGGIAADLMTPGKVLARIESQAALFGDGAKRALTEAISDGTDAVVGRAARGPSEAFRRQGETAQQAFGRTLRSLNKLAQPDVVTRQMAVALGEVADVAPQTATHLAARTTGAIGFLLEKAPGIVRQDPFKPGREERVATARDITVWGRQYQVATDPASVMDLMRGGQLRREHVDTLRELYPRMYSRVQDSAREVLMERRGEIPYAKRRQLDMLLELEGAGEPSAATGFQKGMAAAAQAHAQAEQRRPPSRQATPDVARLSTGIMSDIAQE